MEVNIGTYSDKEVASTATQKDFTLAEGSQTIIFQLFSKKIYSNPIGSIVREITSNCQDSHIEAGVKSPVVIRKTQNEETDECYISFIDFGVGMSPDRIDKIFTTFFASTKNKDNSQIGGFGLGSKTPLTYCRYINRYNQVGEYDNSYQIITIFDGTKYTYVIHEGKSAPQITLMDSQPTKERNGTEVRIPVLKRDVGTFEREITNQLYYFENIIFEGFEDSNVKNDYTIYEGEHFLFRGTAFKNKMHVSLGRVAYPINFELIDESDYKCQVPIALKFNIGDLEVVVSREHLDYTPETIKRIKAKIKLVKAELKKRLEAELTKVTTLEQYLAFDNDFYTLLIGGEKISLSSFMQNDVVTMKNFPYTHLLNKKHHNQIFNYLVDKKIYGAKEPTYNYNSDEIYANNIYILKKISNVYYHIGDFDRVVKKQSYLKSMHKRYYIITKTKLSIDDDVNFDLANMSQVLGCPIDKTVFALLVKIQEDWFNIVQKYAKNYETIEVPEGFGLRGKKYSAELINITIPVGHVNSYGSVSRERFKLGELASVKCRIFYGFNEDRDASLFAVDFVRKFYSSTSTNPTYIHKKNKQVLDTKKNAMYFFLISKGNEKYFQAMPNTHHINEFKNVIVRRKADDFLEYRNIQNTKRSLADLWSPIKSSRFSELNPKYAKYAKGIHSFIKESKVINSDYGYKINEILVHYNLSKDGFTWEEKVVAHYLKSLQAFEKRNQNAIRYIHLPYEISDDDGFWEFVRKNLDIS